ncbi:hypothetical protein H0H93_003964 [Arthromyces matolae]|nr:hypothetical protein H0H93_003964 [Arthromyces matolae]
MSADVTTAESLCNILPPDSRLMCLAELLNECEQQEYWRGRSDAHGVFAATMHDDAASGLSETECERTTCGVLWSYALIDIGATVRQSRNGQGATAKISSYGGMNPDITLNDLGSWAAKVEELIGFDFLTDQSLLPSERGTTEPALYLLGEISRYESQRQSLVMLSNLLSAAFHVRLLLTGHYHVPKDLDECVTPNPDEDHEKQLCKVKQVLLPDGDTAKMQRALAVAITCSPIVLASERSYKRAPNYKEMIAVGMTWHEFGQISKSTDVVAAESFVWECVFELAESLDIAACMKTLLRKVHTLSSVKPLPWVLRQCTPLVPTHRRRNGRTARTGEEDLSENRFDEEHTLSLDVTHIPKTTTSVVHTDTAATATHSPNWLEGEAASADAWADVIGLDDFSQLSPFCPRNDWTLTPTNVAPSYAVSRTSSQTSSETDVLSDFSLFATLHDAGTDLDGWQSPDGLWIDQEAGLDISELTDMSSMATDHTSSLPWNDTWISPSALQRSPHGEEDVTTNEQGDAHGILAKNKREGGAAPCQKLPKRKKPRIVRVSDEDALKEALSRREFRMEHVIEFKSELDLAPDVPILNIATASPMMYCGPKMSFYTAGTDTLYEWFPLFMHDQQLKFCQAVAENAHQKHQRKDPDAWIVVVDVQDMAQGDASIYQQVFARSNIVVKHRGTDSAEFNLESVRKLGSLETCIDIEDQSWPSEGQRRMKGTLAHIVRNSEKANPKPLRGGRIPAMYDALGGRSAGIDVFCSDQFAWEEVKGMEYCGRRDAFPISETRWGQCATAGFLQEWNQERNGMATAISVEVGALLLFVVRPVGDGRPLPLVMDNLCKGGVNWKECSGETVLLTPGVTLLLVPNEVFCYTAIENTIWRGGHFYSTKTLRQSIEGIMRDFIKNGHSFMHTTTTSLLTHMITLFHRNLTLPLPEGVPDRVMFHVPDVTVWEDLLNLIALCVYFELSSALDEWSYLPTPDYKDWKRGMNNRRLARELMGWLFQNHTFTDRRGEVLAGAHAREAIYYRSIAITAQTAIHLNHQACQSSNDGNITIDRDDVTAAFEDCLRNSPVWKIYKSLGEPTEDFTTSTEEYVVDVATFMPIDMTVVDAGTNDRDRLFAHRFKKHDRGKHWIK